MRVKYGHGYTGATHMMKIKHVPKKIRKENFKSIYFWLQL